MYIQTWYTTPKFQYWFSPKKIQGETWADLDPRTHFHSNLGFFEFFFFAKPLRHPVYLVIHVVRIAPSWRRVTGVACFVKYRTCGNKSLIILFFRRMCRRSGAMHREPGRSRLRRRHTSLSPYYVSTALYVNARASTRCQPSSHWQVQVRSWLELDTS